MSLSQEDFDLIVTLREVLQGIREELIRIGEILQDTALPIPTQVNVRKK